MNIAEYEKVKRYTYLQYCDYLQDKYGIGRCDYMTDNWNKNRKVTRTSEGLYVHHKYEDHAIKLSDVEHAKKHPFEWQKKENLLYCDLLEHLFLHELICEHSATVDINVGLGGILQYIVPELNDVYSGFIAKEPWRQKCHNTIIGDKEVYLKLLERIADRNYHVPFINEKLRRSFFAQYGLWSDVYNYNIYMVLVHIDILHFLPILH